MGDARPYRDKAERLLDGITVVQGDAGEEDMERLIRATMANAYATLALRDAVAGQGQTDVVEERRRGGW